MQIACDEAFAPVVAVLSYSSLEEAVRLANDTRYGLQAALFTESIDVAFHLARRCKHVNSYDHTGSCEFSERENSAARKILTVGTRTF